MIIIIKTISIDIIIKLDQPIQVYQRIFVYHHYQYLDHGQKV